MFNIPLISTEVTSRVNETCLNDTCCSEVKLQEAVCGNWFLEHHSTVAAPQMLENMSRVVFHD